MKSLFFKPFLLITVLVMSSTNSLAQYTWEKYASNPLNIHGSAGSWDQSVAVSSVIFNADSNKYEMWYTSYTGSLPNNGIGFAWSTDGITWTKHPTAVLTPSSSSWDNLFIGAPCVLREGGIYKMWYTGGQSGNLSSSHIGYATSVDGITWTKYSGNPILSTGTGWESGAVGYPSVIKISDTYYMFYSGAVTVGIARTGRAISSDGITWQKDTQNNPVLPVGGSGQWDKNNYLGKVIELNSTLYIYYTAESNPGVSGSAIGFASSTDLGITWTKDYTLNPILTQGTGGQWDNGWIEGPCPVFAQNKLYLYYDGGGAATNWLGRIGLATSPISIWHLQNSNFPANVMVINFSTVDNQTCWAVGQKNPPNSASYSGFIRTTNGGTNWTLNTIPGITNGYLAEIFAIDANTAYVTSYKLVGTTGTIGIYKTTDGGVTWNRQDAYNSSQTGAGYIYFFDAQNGVAIGDYLVTYTTTNAGSNWNPVTMPTPLADEWTWLGESRFAVVGNTIWFCTNKGRVFKSTDKGYAWNVILSEPQYSDWRPSIAFQNEQTGIYALHITDNTTAHIVRKTTDGGANWITLSDPVLDNLAPSSMQHIPGSISTYILVGGRISTMRGTAVTHDAGESWSLIDTLGCLYVSFASDVEGWGSQWGTNVVYNYVGPRLVVTSVGEEIINIVPTVYSLSQNYPNPFNPTTTFRYSIPTQSQVVLKVFDILGNEVATLMDEEKSIGAYELTWNTANLASGVYFYQLRAGDFVQTRKMILMK